MELKTPLKLAAPEITLEPAKRRREFRFPVAVTGLVLVFTSLPYLFGYLRAPKGKAFMGIMLDVPDTTQ
jgi:hypothetical protein